MLFLGSLALNIFVALAALVLCLYLYLTRHFNYWKKQGIPYVEPLPFFGNLKDAVLQKFYVGTVLKRIYKEHKHEPYVGIFAFDKPVLLVNDLDIIKNILVKDSQHFMDHNIETDEKKDPIWANILFALKGQRWKYLRHKLSPAFSSGKMKTMFNLVNNCAKQLTDVLDNRAADGSPVPVKETLARFTTDAISTCALGIESNSLKNPNSEVRQRMRNVFEFSCIKGVGTVLMFFAPQVFKAMKMKYLDEGTSTFFRNTVWETVKYREQHGVVRKDLLDSMIELRKTAQVESGDKNFSFDGDMFVAQAFNIFIGGFETSSSATTFMLYELAKHPEIQSRLRKDIIEVLQKHNNQVTYDAIYEMKYLDMVVSETLRKYPVLGFLDRVCTKDYNLPRSSGKEEFSIKKGTSIYIPLQGIHTNPEYFPDPDRFDPERFTEEQILKRHSYAYFPFGEGPRFCMGKRFGVMQIKTAVSHILPRFQVSPCKETPLQISHEPRSFILQTKHEIPLIFKRIQI